jgi:hypothetical protein
MLIDMSNKTTWRILINDCLSGHNEIWEDVVKCTLSEMELDEKFDDGYGGSEGKPFTLWTKNRVYFPIVYDGAEWVESVPRNPCDEISGHFGGE